MTQTARSDAAAPGSAPSTVDHALLDTEVRDLMTPGCLTISEAASVAEAADALAAHRVHAILVLGASNGTPLGWITARGLLGWLGRDRTLPRAREAITERVTSIDPFAYVRAAHYALSLPNTTHLLVRRKPHVLPEGVVTEYDLATAGTR